MSRGKTYKDAREQVDRDREYAPFEAVRLVKQLKRAKFDESVEIHVRTGLNVRHADEQLRGTIALPHGLGKEVTIAVFAKGDKAREAEAAGADFVGDEDLAKRIQEGFTDFDVAIATPDMMPIVGRLGRITQAQLREIAEKKLPDLNAHDVDQAAKIIAGTARSMGVEVV